MLWIKSQVSSDLLPPSMLKHIKKFCFKSYTKVLSKLELNPLQELGST